MYIIHIVTIEDGQRKSFTVSATTERTAKAIVNNNNKNGFSWYEKK